MAKQSQDSKRQAENLRLGVSNTFLHVTDVDEEFQASKLRPSQSQPSLSSSSGSSLGAVPAESAGSSGSRNIPTRAHPKPDGDEHVVYNSDSSEHVVYNSESDSGSSSSKNKPGSGLEDQPRPEGDPPGEPPGWIDPILLKGAALHSIGQCKPCAWAWQSIGCANGSDCSFCHVEHGQALLTRKQRKRAKEVRLEKRDQREASEAGAGAASGSMGIFQDSQSREAPGLWNLQSSYAVQDERVPRGSRCPPGSFSTRPAQRSDAEFADWCSRQQSAQGPRSALQIGAQGRSGYGQSSALPSFADWYAQEQNTQGISRNSAQMQSSFSSQGVPFAPARGMQGIHGMDRYSPAQDIQGRGSGQPVGLQRGQFSM